MFVPVIVCVLAYLRTSASVCVSACISACIQSRVRLGCMPATSAGVLWECCMEKQLKIPDQCDGCLWASCEHRHAHLPPVPHLLDPWINLMSGGRGQDFNKHPTKLSNLMSAQWMILYVQQTPIAKHFHCKLENGFWSNRHVQYVVLVTGQVLQLVHKHFHTQPDC